MVTVASWNIHCIPVLGGCAQNHIEKVSQYATRLVQEHDAQVLVLNEVFLPRVRAEMLHSLRRDTGRTWNMTPIANSTGVAPLVGSGVVIAWRDDLKKAGSVHEVAYKECCQFDCLSHKGGLQLPLRDSGGNRFHVVGTHMQAWEIPVLCDGTRARQALTLGNTVTRLEEAGHIRPVEPVLLAGDFNEKHSVAMERRLGAKHVVCEGDCRTHSEGEYDHFYLREGDQEKVQHASFRKVSVGGLSNPSDHAPIITTLAV